MKKLVIPISILVFALSLSISCKKDENGDKSQPYIIVNPPNPQFWGLDIPYVDAGAEAWDITTENDTVDITNRMIVSDNVNVDELGEYNVNFNVSDEAGNQADEKVRLVKVVITK